MRLSIGVRLIGKHGSKRLVELVESLAVKPRNSTWT
jgi:hypothetical protein